MPFGGAPKCKREGGPPSSSDEVPQLLPEDAPMHRLRAACDAPVRDTLQFRANGFILIRLSFSYTRQNQSNQFVNRAQPQRIYKSYKASPSLARAGYNKELFSSQHTSTVHDFREKGLRACFQRIFENFAAVTGYRTTFSVSEKFDFLRKQFQLEQNTLVVWKYRVPFIFISGKGIHQERFIDRFIVRSST